MIGFRAAQGAGAALIETDAHGWLSAFTLALIGAAVALGACFVLWERVCQAPLVPLALLRRRSFAVANGLLAVEYGITAGVLFLLTLFFQNVKGWSALETGIAMIALNFPFLARHARGPARPGGRRACS